MQKLLTPPPIAVPQAKGEEPFFEDTCPPVPAAGPSREESERDYCVDRIDDELTFVTRDDDVCYHGSNALSLLSEQIRRRDLRPISRQQANRLRARLQLARDALLPFFSNENQRRMTAGLTSAEKFVDWWALSKERRKAQPSYLGREHRLRLRWLQNALHNLCIEDELAESASSRQANVIASLKSGAGAAS